MSSLKQSLPDQFTAFRCAAESAIDKAQIYQADIKCFMREGLFVITQSGFEVIYDPERFEDICRLQIDTHSINQQIKDIAA